MTGFYSLVLGGLAVWRLTHLLNAEDGPAGVLVRLRVQAGQGVMGDLLDCFDCLSLVLGLPVAAWLAAEWREGVGLWLALSGAACLLERCTSGASAPHRFTEQTEADDGVLR